ncbi:MAG: endolytic transglycosylase MltG, partial [Acidobacteriaceae bacterium]|nr:endolytic transglycosylase MltG [Acidobacteriaceae bacterium]
DPQAPSLEGYLFPSTYRVTHKTTARQLCRMMTDELRKQWKTLGGKDRTDQVHQIVTLASLVEKETAAPVERPEIASVFLNRLRLHMPLQCDPTTVYAALLENRYRGVIHKSDLASASPYNTYTHAGLPPGPIANPGLLSLKAALFPADTNFLYFVAKPNGAGAHVFSATLEEHERAVAEYRRTAH